MKSTNQSQISSSLRERCADTLSGIVGRMNRPSEGNPLDLLEYFAREIRNEDAVLIRKAYQHSADDHCPTRTMKPRIKYDCHCSDEQLGCQKAIDAIALAAGDSEEQ